MGSSGEIGTYKLAKRKMKLMAIFFARCICSFHRYGNGSIKMAKFVTMSSGDVP